MENLRQLSAWPLTSADLSKVENVLDAVLADAQIEGDTKPGQRIARSILSAYALGVTDSHDLLTYGRVIAKAETHRPDSVDFEAARSVLN
ncbi:hypothetical protein DEM27_32820 [Metarhizobium album]|uniref:Uncharacterized protein n=1 Tax=Metarhizobium album TaxID=2182425 RepID=A0A2U2DFJ9_9HYPH|nr:hypothetical protein [Rhizobium album]PWE52096.1 hypothetical protein DEM27_32820 [Rhizobium album]